MKLISAIRNLFAPVEREPPKVVCPCCGYVTLNARGRWEICAVCFWEDGMDYDNDDDPSGCNHGITLNQGRANYKEFGACEWEMRKHVRPREYGAPPVPC